MKRSAFLVAALVLLAATRATAQAKPQAPPQSPCPSGPEWHQFDFWLGKWDVMDHGKVIATSTIEKSSGGCIVHETYTEPSGYTGRSVNFFDPTLRRWRQTWVDSVGGVSEFSGEYRDGAMRLEGETHLGNGQKILRRMTLSALANGQVRQFSEKSVDGGKTWSVAYDFQYVKAH